jgi:hypothetical protein
MDAENAPKFKCLETLANRKVKHYAISTVNYIITITEEAIEIYFFILLCLWESCYIKEEEVSG